MKHKLLLSAVALAVLFGTAQFAAGFPVPPAAVPIGITGPTPVDPTNPPLPVYICVWYKMTGPGPYTFEPDPNETRPILDVEIDIPNDGLPPFQLDPTTLGPAPWGPFNQWELLDVVTGVTEGGVEMDFLNVGHWYDGELKHDYFIEVECPDATAEDYWYIHFTPEPGTLVLLCVGGLAVLRRRRRA